MVEPPGLELIAQPAAVWEFAGPLATRLESVVGRVLMQRGPQAPSDLRIKAARFEVRSAPPEHVGLGVGTQLGLAAVRLILKLAGEADPGAESLAELSGRGRRSGIGLHGFLHGGLIVDGGRLDELRPPPLLARLPFPEEWSILIVQPPGPPGRHGHDEVQAFRDLPPLAERVSDRLCRLVLLGILPAVAERDLATFGEALGELQARVGTAFASIQGGAYASAQSAEIIAELRNLGLCGAGQSSWGPSLYAFGILGEAERSELAARLRTRWGFDPAAILWTKAANHGARLAAANEP
jgi:beta-RFAP synthase